MPSNSVRGRRGRPEVGERVAVRLPPALLERIDREAQSRGESRAQAMRRLLDAGLVAPVPDGVDRAQIQRMLAMSPRERVRHMADVANRMARYRDRARRSLR